MRKVKPLKINDIENLLKVLYEELVLKEQSVLKGIKKEKLADKPGSVPALLQTAVIHLGIRLPACSSSLPGSGASHAIATLFGLAPDGGYRVSHPPCGLLVSVALFLALGFIAKPCCVRPLAVILLCGARTFLPLFAQAATAWPASMGILTWASIPRANQVWTSDQITDK